MFDIWRDFQRKSPSAKKKNKSLQSKDRSMDEPNFWINFLSFLISSSMGTVFYNQELKLKETRFLLGKNWKNWAKTRFTREGGGSTHLPYPPPNFFSVCLIFNSSLLIKRWLPCISSFMAFSLFLGNLTTSSLWTFTAPRRRAAIQRRLLPSLPSWRSPFNTRWKNRKNMTFFIRNFGTVA